MKRIVVLGAGFAGLIAAVGAARKLAELKIPASDIAVTIVNRDPWHSIRVRNYETDMSDVRVALDGRDGPDRRQHRYRRGDRHRLRSPRNRLRSGRMRNPLTL